MASLKYFCVASLLAALGRGTQPCTVDRATGTTIDSRPFVTNTYATRWSFANNLLAAMQPGANGYYRLITMRPDGSDVREITEGRPKLPSKHEGTPYWHPSGRYIFFVAQKQDWHGAKLFGSPDYEALPGFGRHDDLWLTTADGSHNWQLTNEPNTKDEGVLIPVFSPNGKLAAWSARQTGGTYVLKVADFSESPEPHLSNVRSYKPGGAAYYETGSFSSDNGNLIYTSDQDTHSFWRSQIYRLDLRTGKSTRLTTGDDYNEHPTVVKTPSGDWIVYMTTRGAKRQPLRVALGTDWFAMRLDGSGAKRLTSMNVDAGNPENTKRLMVAGTAAVSPAGDFMLGDVQDSLVKQTGLVKVVRFACQ